jgi:hypothetical protein
MYPNGIYGAIDGEHESLVKKLASRIEKLTNYTNDIQRIWNHSMSFAAIINRMDLVEFFIVDKGADNWNLGLNYAAEKGQRETVDFFINKGANDWFGSICSAAENGHRDIVYFLSSYVFGGSVDDWNSCMNSAALGNHIDLIEFFITMGACDWFGGIMASIGRGHLESVKFLAGKYVDMPDKHLSKFVGYADYEKRTDIAEFFRKKHD